MFEDFQTNGPGQGSTGQGQPLTPELAAWTAQVEALLVSSPRWMNPAENKAKGVALRQSGMARFVSTEAVKRMVKFAQAAHPEETMIIDLQGALSLLAIGIDLGQKMIMDQTLARLDTTVEGH